MDQRNPIVRARELEPILLKCAMESPSARRLSPTTSKAIADARLSFASVPSEFGGEGVDAGSYYRMIETVAYADSAAGWCVNVWAEHADIVSSYFPPATVRGVLRSPEVLICGSNRLNATEARRVDRGVRITGRFHFASGVHNSHYATWGTFLTENGAPIFPGADGKPLLTTGLVAIENLKVLDTWTAIGMEASGTHDFELHDVFVPDACLIHGFQNPYRHGLSVKLTIFGFLTMTKCAVLTGIARSILDDVIKLSREKKKLFASDSLASVTTVQERIGRAEADLRSARALMFKSMEDLENMWSMDIGIDRRAKTILHLAMVNASRKSLDVALMAHQVSGTSATLAGSPIQRKLRDLLVGQTHPNLSEDRLASLGKYFALGEDPFAAMPI